MCMYIIIYLDNSHELNDDDLDDRESCSSLSDLESPDDHPHSNGADEMMTDSGITMHCTIESSLRLNLHIIMSLQQV